MAGLHSPCPRFAGILADALTTFTLIETSSLCDVDPRAWLADVLARIADHPVSRIHDLLPWNWRTMHAQPQAA
jgi:hypothetical protein